MNKSGVRIYRLKPSGRKVVKAETGKARIIIGQGVDSLMRWLDSGPHGEAAQMSMNNFDTDDSCDEFDDGGYGE